MFVCFRRVFDSERRKLTPRRAQTVNLDKEKGNVVSGEGDDITSLVGASEGDDSEDESYDFSGDIKASEEVSYVDSDEANASENEVDQLSEYEDSESLLGSDNEVLEHIEFRKFKWQVGLSFPNSRAFRDALKHYALIQGRNMRIDISNKKRQQRIGVSCVEGCPFKMYGSWDKSSTSFVIKSVIPEHTCQRSMDGNKQLKSSWVANQMLEVFKSRPHIPSVERVDLVKKKWYVIISKHIAYNIKYAAQKRLHGSRINITTK